MFSLLLYLIILLRYWYIEYFHFVGLNSFILLYYRRKCTFFSNLDVEDDHFTLNHEMRLYKYDAFL